MFDVARAAGLPMLGGIDFFVPSASGVVRAHFWSAGWPALSLHDQASDLLQLRLKCKKTDAATIVILPGFTEFCEKYSSSVLRLHRSGHDVLIIDWPGQGLSGHYGKDPLAVHCDDFCVYLEALDAVIEAVGLSRDQFFLFGHSMGGHLALRYAACRPSLSLGVMLSAPMMAPPVMPVWFIRGLTKFLLGMRLGHSYPPFHRVPELDWVRHYRPDNKLTRWPQGYESQFFWLDDMPNLRRSGPTIGWVNAAYRSSAKFTLNADWLQSIEVPILAFVAGDEKIVSAAATDYALPLIPKLDRYDFDDARHELLNELPKVTDQLWTALLAFIEKNRVP